MHTLDLLILGVYLAAVVALGARFSRRQATVRDYFLTDQQVPWWALLASIVATETSTVTLISVPGYAFGGDLTFLQLALGYIVGKIFVAVVLIPRFFQGHFLTAYQPLSQRFGPLIGRLTAAIFLVTRSLSDGFRLFATGLMLAAVLATLPTATAVAHGLMPSLDLSASLLVVSVCLIGGTTVAYTLLGGMRAVIWTDVIQLVVYTTGAIIAALMVLSEIPGGWMEVINVAGPAGKLVSVDLTLDLTKSYTFWSGVIGGMFLAAGTHGTDQMFVQRYLCSRSPRDASRALIWSGVFVLIQFGLFLGIGLLLWVYYTVYSPDGLAAITVNGIVQTDRILPTFIMSHLPVGLRGLVVASVVAAAMSTLSSSLNSAAASTVGDFYIPLTGDTRSARHYLAVSRWATAGWALVQVVVAVVAIDLSSRVVDEVLGIQSFTLGLLLGVFLLAMTTTRRLSAPLTGILGGTAVLLALRLLTDVSWQWYVLVGTFTTWGLGWITGRVLGRDSSESP
jgi:SSS family transporter